MLGQEYDLLIKKRLTAKPVQMDLFAAAMRCNISRRLMGGFVAHGNPGTPHLIAVKAPGVAVCGGKDGISSCMLRFLLHRAADKPHLVGIFHVVHRANIILNGNQTLCSLTRLQPGNRQVSDDLLLSACTGLLRLCAASDGAINRIKIIYVLAPRCQCLS